MASSNVWVKQRAVIECFVAENVKPVDVQKRLLLVNGNKFLDINSVRVVEYYGLKTVKSEKSLFLIRIDVDVQ